MKINTNELEGAALDWAAAVAEERNVGVWSVDEQREWFLVGTSPGTSKALHKIHQSFRPIVCDLREDGVKVPYPRIAYSSDPAQAWPIIDRYKISLIEVGGTWYSRIRTGSLRERDATGSGPTGLVAAVRCFVAFKLGDEVEFPDELIKDRTEGAGS